MGQDKRLGRDRSLGWGGGAGAEARKWGRDKVRVGQQSGEIDQRKGGRDIGGERLMGKMSREKGWDRWRQN